MRKTVAGRVAAVALPLISDPDAELVAGACALATRERNAPQAAHFARKVAELGRALGFEVRTEPPADPDEAEVVWEKAGRPVRRIVVRASLAASQLLKAVPAAGGPPCVVVLTAEGGLTAEAVAAVRKVVPLSRPGLKTGEVTLVHAPAGQLGRIADAAVDMFLATYGPRPGG